MKLSSGDCEILSAGPCNSAEEMESRLLALRDALVGSVVERWLMARSTKVALGYVVLGLGYVGMLVILLNAIWTGSLMRLWQDAWDFASSIQPVVVAMLINFVAAAMIYRYDRHGRTVRLLGALVAAGLFVVSSMGAIQVLRLWQRGLLPVVVPPEAVWVRPIGALIYGWLAFEVIRLLRAFSVAR